MNNDENSQRRQQNPGSSTSATPTNRSHSRQQIQLPTSQSPFAQSQTANSHAEQSGQNQIDYRRWMERMAWGDNAEHSHPASMPGFGATSHQRAPSTLAAPSPSERFQPRQMIPAHSAAVQDGTQHPQIHTVGSPAPLGSNLMDPRTKLPKSHRMLSGNGSFTSSFCPGSLPEAIPRTQFTMGHLDDPFLTTPTPRPHPLKGTSTPGDDRDDGRVRSSLSSLILIQSSQQQRPSRQQRRSSTVEQSGGGGRQTPLHKTPNNHSSQGTSSRTRGFPSSMQVPPLDLSRRHYNTPDNAVTYLMTPLWRPTSKSHCIPQSDADRLPYVKKLYDAMVDSTDIWDSEFFSFDALRFRRDGWWGLHPEAIEAISHKIVQLCLNIHTTGVTGQALRCIPRLNTVAYKHDREFTFAERIHWFAFLVRHFKFNANMVMREDCILQYLAKVWSTLMEKEEFIAWWKTLSKEEIDRKYDEAYDGMPARPMTKEEKKQYEEVATTEALRAMAVQDQRARQAAQSQQAQIQARHTTKRPVDAVELLEAGPPTKRPNLDDQVNEDAAVATASQEPAQQQAVDDETAEQRAFGNVLTAAEGESFADRHPSPLGDQDRKFNVDAEHFGGATSPPPSKGSHVSEEDHASISISGEGEEDAKGKSEDEDADGSIDDGARGEVG